MSYHPFGGVKGFTFGNGQPYRRTIDLDGRIAGYSLGNASYTVGFDAASRITSLAQGAGPGNTYGYDLLDRLSSAVMPTVSQGFGYDAKPRQSRQKARPAPMHMPARISTAMGMDSRLRQAAKRRM